MNTESGEQPSGEKYTKLDDIKSRVEAETDALGHEIDPGIKDTVVALNAMGVCTVQSCEGHTETGMAAPWVEIGAPNQPEQRYVNQETVFQQIAKERGIDLDGLKRGYPEQDAWLEAMDTAAKNGETPEHKAWRTETAKLKSRVESLLTEFYANREVPNNVRIVVEDTEEGGFDLHNGGPDYQRAPKDLSEGGKRDLVRRQETYRKEMQDFAGFLKSKFLAGL